MVRRLCAESIAYCAPYVHEVHHCMRKILLVSMMFCGGCSSGDADTAMVITPEDMTQDAGQDAEVCTVNVIGDGLDSGLTTVEVPCE
jgi:hypothetical protein